MLVDSWIQVDWRNWLGLVHLPFLTIRRNSEANLALNAMASDRIRQREPVACWGTLMGTGSSTEKNTVCSGP